VRAALAACLVAVALAGCAGPFDDDGEPAEFERMQSFSVVLVANGLLTGDARPLTSAQAPQTTADAPQALTGELAAGETPPADGEPPELAPEVAAAVVAALTKAAPVAEREAKAANARLRDAGGKGAGAPLGRLAAASRTLDRELSAIGGAPPPVQALARATRRVTAAVRDLRSALAAGRVAAAQEALERYAAQAATVNGLAAGLRLEGWPADQRVFP
jgi:hypothetical protein